MIGIISYAETEIPDCILIKLKTCFSIKYKFCKSNFSNTRICQKKLACLFCNNCLTSFKFTKVSRYCKWI